LASFQFKRSAAKVKQLKLAENLNSFQYRKLRRKSGAIKNLPTFGPVLNTESSEAEVKQLKFADILASFQYRNLRN
jgi:hypothetical protein